MRARRDYLQGPIVGISIATATTKFPHRFQREASKPSARGRLFLHLEANSPQISEGAASSFLYDTQKIVDLKDRLRFSEASLTFEHGGR
jgi:hypothetical protein